MPKSDYDQLLATMPVGLDRAVLRVISMHPGKDAAITKPRFLADLAQIGFKVNERQLRKTIVDLRKDGHLICSSSGDAGYYLADSYAEYQEFSQVEYRSKIIDMSETLHAMDDSAKSRFGNSYQIGLF